MNNARDNQFETEIEIPAGLKRSLRASCEPGFEVPTAVDATMRMAARRHFRAGRRRRLLRVWVPVGAAAAVILMVLMPSEPARRSASGLARPAHVAAQGDITILDAFALARQLKAQESPGEEWDYNADRIIDQRDVEALAMAAVRLEVGT